MSLWHGRHRARLFQGRPRFGRQLKLGPQVFIRAGIEPKYVGRFRLVYRVLDSGTQAGTRRLSQLEYYRPLTWPLTGNLRFPQALSAGRKGRNIQ